MTPYAQALATEFVVVPALWGVWLAAFFGIGRLMAGLVGAPPPRELTSLLRDVWLGLAVSEIALVVWSLGLPVNGVAATTLLLAGSAGLWRDHRAVRASLRHPGWLIAAAAVAMVWLVANRSVAPMVNYDSASYEFPGMAWAETYAVVPGLANLHGRLGFNNANVLLAAALDRGPWAGHAHNLLNGLLIVLIASTLWAEGRRAVPALRGSLICLVAPLVVMLQNPEAVASLTADTPATVFTMAAVVLTLVAIRQARQAEACPGLLLTIVACAVSAVAAKLSAVLIAGGTALVAVAWSWRVVRPGPRQLGIVVAVVVVGATAWLGRGAILSGYLVYPSGVLSVNVDWRVPDAGRRAELEVIRQDNRYMYRRMPANEWPTPAAVVRWARSTFAFREARAAVLLPAMLMLLGLSAMAGEAVVRRRIAWGDWVLVLPVLAGIALWWVMAPTPEFGFFVFWIGAAITFGPVTARAFDRGPVWRYLALAALAGVAVSPLVLDLKQRAEVGGMARAVVSAIAWRPALALPAFPLRPYVTASGAALTYPAADEQCGPVVMCTPHPAPNLVLRVPDDPGRGFRVDGDWQAVWFPARVMTSDPHWRALPHSR